MDIFKKEFKHFLYEASSYEMKIGDYVECCGNFTKITPVKGLVAEIIGLRYRPKNRYETTLCFTLKFDFPLVDKRSGVPIESDTIEITVNQIRNLKVRNGNDHRRIIAGFTVKYEASPRFQAMLRFIAFTKNHNYYDASYFDVDEKGDVSMLPANKINITPEAERYTSKQRQPTKITRILQKLNDKLTAQQVADYGNSFTAKWKELNVNITDRIKVVTGNDITFWYHEKNYFKPEHGAYGGTLNGSCMRYDNTQTRVAFYSKYPEKVALCILLDNSKTKLLARALVWKLDKPEGVIFMDRIYYVTQEHETILANYANKMGWKTKLCNYHIDNKIIVEIPHKHGEPLPYLDTLKSINYYGKTQFSN